MNDSSQKGTSVALWLILAAGLIVRLILSWTDIHTLLLLNVPDDAFYGFKVAQNIAAGHGSTFDGLHLTNGYHPLWMGFLIPLYRIFPDRLDLPVNVALTIQSFIDIGTAAYIYRIARTVFSSRGWAALAAALYVFNPNVIFYQIDGIETALATFLTVVVFYLFIRDNGPDFATWGQRLLFAAATGLMLLARTDTIFICAILFLLCAIHEWRTRRQIHRSIAMGVLVTIVVAPWLLWNYLTFHHIVQVSAIARPLVLRQNLQGSVLAQGFKLLKYELTYEWPVQNGLASGVFVLLAVAAFMLTRPGTKPKALEPGWSVICWAWLALFITILFHCFARLHPRPWYSALFPVLNALTICWAGRRIWNLPRARRAICYTVGFIFLAYVLTGAYTVWMKKYIWQGEFYRVSQWLRTNTPPETRVGAFNAGIVGYFSQRTVINLDGAINNSAFYALRNRQLRNYVWDNSIAYIADFRFTVEIDHRRFWNEGHDELELERDRRFPAYPIYWERSGMALYKILKPPSASGGYGQPPLVLAYLHQNLPLHDRAHGMPVACRRDVVGGLIH